MLLNQPQEHLFARFSRVEQTRREPMSCSIPLESDANGFQRSSRSRRFLAESQLKEASNMIGDGAAFLFKREVAGIE